MRWKNGDFFEGDFRKGERDGQGTLTKKKDKETLEGSWLKNQLNGIASTKNETEMYKGDYSQGKKVKKLILTLKRMEKGCFFLLMSLIKLIFAKLLGM